MRQPGGGGWYGVAVESQARISRVAGLLLVVLALGGAVRLAHFGALCWTNYPEVMLASDQMDMRVTWDWSGEILAGDVLGRNPYHPAFHWMLEIAPMDTWPLPAVSRSPSKAMAASSTNAKRRGREFDVCRWPTAGPAA